MVGIPYRWFVEFAERDGTLVEISECPECGQEIVETEMKDFESFKGVAYAAHWAQTHDENVADHVSDPVHLR